MHMNMGKHIGSEQGSGRYSGYLLPKQGVSCVISYTLPL